MGRRSNFAAARNAHHLAVERMGDGSESGEEESDENEEIKGRIHIVTGTEEVKGRWEPAEPLYQASALPVGPDSTSLQLKEMTSVDADENLSARQGVEAIECAGCAFCGKEQARWSRPRSGWSEETPAFCQIPASLRR